MVYYYPCFRWRIRDRSRSGISQALKSILQSSTSTQPSFPRFLQAGFYVIGGSQSLRRRTSRLPLWQYPYKYFIRKCRTLQDGFPAFFFFHLLNPKFRGKLRHHGRRDWMRKDSALYQLMDTRMNGVMNRIISNDGKYQAIIRKSDEYSVRLEKVELSKEIWQLIDRYVSEQNTHSTFF